MTLRSDITPVTALAALVLHGCLVPNTLRGRDAGAAPTEAGPDARADEADASDTSDDRSETHATDALDASDEADALDAQGDIADASNEPDERLDAADAADAADVLDAIDVLDANDVVDVVDVVDATDVLDANDVVDVTDALDAPTDNGPDASITCAPMVPFVTLDDLRSGLPMSWAQRRGPETGAVTMTADGAAQIAGGAWVGSTSCGASSDSYRTRAGGTWDLRASRTMRTTDVRIAVRTRLSTADPSGVECAYNIADAALVVRRRSGGAEAASPGNFLGAPPDWIHMDVWDDGATVRCTATSPRGAHIEASLDVSEAPAGYVAFYTSGGADRVAVLDDLVYERGLVPALHEYNLSEESATDPAIDRIGTAHGRRGATAAVAADALLGRGLRGMGTFTNNIVNATEGVTFPSTVMPSGTADFTVSVWIFQTYGEGNDDREIFGSRSSDSGGNYFGLTIQGHLGGAALNVLRAELAQSSPSVLNATLRGRTVVRRDEWRHVAAVRSGARLRLFVNGAPDGEVTSMSPIGPSPIALTSAHDFALGRQFIPSRMIAFKGTLDELRVYGVALTAEQIAALGAPPSR